MKVLRFLLMFILAGIILAYLATRFFGKPAAMPKTQSVTRFVESSIPPVAPSTEWLEYKSITPAYSISYPPFWNVSQNVAGGLDNCSGPLFSTQTENSRMVICQVNLPGGLQDIKSQWLGKTTMVDRFIGGHLGVEFEYKTSSNQYDYYAVVENIDTTDLLQFHLVTDVGEKDSSRQIFKKILDSLLFLY